MAVFVLSVYVSPQILFECTFEFGILLIKLYQIKYLKTRLPRIERPQVAVLVLSVYVSLQILPGPPSVLSWGPNSSLRLRGGPSRRDAPRLFESLYLSKFLAKFLKCICVIWSVRWFTFKDLLYLDFHWFSSNLDREKEFAILLYRKRHADVIFKWWKSKLSFYYITNRFTKSFFDQGSLL